MMKSSHYRSMGDLRLVSNGQQQSVWPAPHSAMRSKRHLGFDNGFDDLLGSTASLSRSMIQLNQQHQHLQQQQPRHRQPTYLPASETSFVYAQPPPPQSFKPTSTRRKRVGPQSVMADMTNGPMRYAGEDASMFGEPHRQLSTKRSSSQLFSPPGQGQGLSNGLYQSNLASSTSHLEPSAVVDPELKNASKHGDRYHITMSLTALAASQPQQQQSVPMQTDTYVGSSYGNLRDASMPLIAESLPHRSPYTSRIDLTEDSDLHKVSVSERRPSPSTTVVYVTDENSFPAATTVAPSRVSTSVTNVDSYHISHSSRQQLVPSPTLNIDSSGYRITSVRSMTDLRDIEKSDEKVEFDVELDPLDVKSTQQTINVQWNAGVGRSGMAEASESSQRSIVIDGNPPNYMMTLHDTMVMSYVPQTDNGTEQQSVMYVDDEEDANNAAPRPISPDFGADNEVPTHLAAAPKLFVEHSTQSTEPNVSKSTQTIKNRGTQTDDQNKGPKGTRRSRPNSAQSPMLRVTENGDHYAPPPLTDPLAMKPTARPNDNNKRPSSRPITPAVNVRNQQPAVPDDLLRLLAPSPGPLLNAGNDDYNHQSTRRPVTPTSKPQSNQPAVPDEFLRLLAPSPGPLLNAENENYNYRATSRPVTPSVMQQQSNKLSPNQRQPTVSDEFLRLLAPSPGPVRPPNSNGFDDTDSLPVPVIVVSRPGTALHNEPPAGRDSIRVLENLLNSGDDVDNERVAAPDDQDALQSEQPFGYHGEQETMAEGRDKYVQILMSGAPSGSITQKEYRHVEEEEIFGPLSSQTNENITSVEDTDAVLNFDTVSEKVDLNVQDGMAQLTVIVRCERILPVRYTVDMFKKTTVVVTRVIEVDLLVTEQRRQLYEEILAKERQSHTGRLSNRDTFDLYQTFMSMAKQDEEQGLKAQQQVRIDRHVGEHRLLELQLNDRIGSASNEDRPFDVVDGRLPAVQSSHDLDVRAQSSIVHSRKVRQH